MTAPHSTKPTSPALGHPPALPVESAPGVRWGPNNPHPLSAMKTELAWAGTYDEWGNRREVDIAGCAMPMQRIETIDQSRSAATGQLASIRKEMKIDGLPLPDGTIRRGCRARPHGRNPAAAEVSLSWRTYR